MCYRLSTQAFSLRLVQHATGRTLKTNALLNSFQILNSVSKLSVKNRVVTLFRYCLVYIVEKTLVLKRTCSTMIK